MGGLTRRPGLDLFAIRHVIREVPTCQLLDRTWCAFDYQGPGLGLAPGDAVPRRHFAVSGEPEATRLLLLTTLGNSVLVPQGAALAEVVVRTTTGDLPPISLCAGEHVGEACGERADVRAQMRHRLPVRSLSTPAQDAAGQPFLTHQFLSELPLKGRHRVTGIEMRWLGDAAPILRVQRMTLVDETLGTQTPVMELVWDALYPWEQTREGPRSLRARNPWPLRRAWLASRLETLPETVIRDIVSGRANLPDGAAFSPYDMALIEEVTPFVPGEPSTDDDVQITRAASSRIELQVRTTNGAFLVLGDINYPGWCASVDGISTRVRTTDYVFRGVVVPPGEHRVVFDFRPRSFRWGLLLTTLASLVLMGFLVLPWIRGVRSGLGS